MRGEIEICGGVSVRIENGEILIEPGQVRGVACFTVHLTGPGARALATKLLGAAVRLMPPTCGGGSDGQ